MRVLGLRVTHHPVGGKTVTLLTSRLQISLSKEGISFKENPFPGPITHMPKRHMFILSTKNKEALLREEAVDLGFLSWAPDQEPVFSKEDFEPTIRYKETPQVYVFHGPSGIGKSFLGFHIEGLSVYETDSELKLPDDLNEYEVIVLGNRSGFTLNDVKEKLTGVNVIPVQFGV